MTNPIVQQNENVEEQKQNDKEYNFAQLRKQLEQERAQSEEWRRKAEAIEREKEEIRKKIAQNTHSSSFLGDDDDDSSDEPYIDKKALNRKLSRFKEGFQKEVEQQAELKARAILDEEKKNSFLKQNPDFSEVLTPEILTKFAEKHPEIAEQMLEMPASFARQKLLYQNIKALGVHRKEDPKPPIQETIDKNRKNAFYIPSGMGSAPYSAATGDFSPAGQKSSYAKMQELKSRLRI